MSDCAPEFSEGPDSQTPFQILVMGDFSGRANRGVLEPLASRADSCPIRVDCDSLDSVMKKLGVTLNLPMADSDQVVELKFNSLEDFHPDTLYDRVSVFQTLGKIRQGLLDSTTFENAAAEVLQWVKASSNAVFHRSESRVSDTAVSDQGEAVSTQLMDQLDTSSSQDQLVAMVDAVMNQQMQGMIHHKDFLALEALWRSLDFLVCHLETNEHLRIYMLDITKEELAVELSSSESWRSSGLYHLMVNPPVEVFGGAPWALSVGDFTFDATIEDAQLLAGLASIGAMAGSPFLAAADPRLLGCPSLLELSQPGTWTEFPNREIGLAWQTLRHLPQATYAGLFLPRFLMRLPYGESTEPIDRFSFEEVDACAQQGSFVWGNGAFIGAYWLGHEFSQYGWGFTPGTEYDVDDLPSHTYKQDDQLQMTPCAQAWFTEPVAEEILARGFMPLLSVPGRDAVKFLRFQSLAEPTKSLAGRWERVSSRR